MTVPGGAALDLQPGTVNGTISSNPTTGALTIGTTGNYLIEWALDSHLCHFNLEVDGTAAPSCMSINPSAPAEVGAMNNCIVSITAGSVVTLVSNAGNR